MDRTTVEALAEDERELVAAAAEARDNAHAPYSGYRVGAAARRDDGGIQAGCNVEISSYGLTLCAERVALFAARARAAEPVRALAVVGPGGPEGPTPPCGACRQVLYDLAPEATVLLATTAGAVERWSARGLLPFAFGPEHLRPAAPPADS